jgi:hypothetical protein
VKANWVRRINHSQALTRRWALLFASSDWMQEEPAKNESQIAL